MPAIHRLSGAATNTNNKREDGMGLFTTTTIVWCPNDLELESFFAFGKGLNPSISENVFNSGSK